MTKSIVITGYGLVTPEGNNLQDIFNQINNGGSFIWEFKEHNLPLPCDSVGASVNEAELTTFLKHKKQSKYMNKEGKMAVQAAGLALESAGLLDDISYRERMGLYVGTGLITFEIDEVFDMMNSSLDENGNFDVRLMGSLGLEKCHPLMPFKLLSNMPLSHISLCFGFTGDNFILYPSAGQTGAALESAVRIMQLQKIDSALVGGTANNINPLPLSSFLGWGWIGNNRTVFPFTEEHNGYGFSDGAGFLVLETYENAKRRGLDDLVEIVGIELSHGQDRFRNLAALQDKTGIDKIDLVISVSNKSKYDDMEELEIIEQLFGKNCQEIVVSYTGVTGYMSSAAIPLNIALARMIIKNGEVPCPHIPSDVKIIDSDLILKAKRKTKIKTILINSFDPYSTNFGMIIRCVE